MPANPLPGLTRPAPGWRTVPRPRRPVVFINPHSGGGTAVRLALAERARERGIEPVVLDADDDLGALAARAAEDGADALAVAGGDGSMAVVAAVACARDLPFACIPAGTRNHFARDLGVARRDVVGALDAFVDGVERRIDVGDVNGRLFLDNVTLGFYGDAVRREDYRDHRLRTLLETAQEALGPGASASGIALIDDRGAEHRDPALVMVSNNPYALDRQIARSTRPRLDTGRVGVIVLGRPAPARRDRAWTTSALEVAAPGEVHAGIDGEPVTLVPLLRFAIRPAALRVRISAQHPGASPSAQLSSLDPRRRGGPPFTQSE